MGAKEPDRPGFDHPQAESYGRQIDQVIRDNGWAVVCTQMPIGTYVLYTVGLTASGIPELVIEAREKAAGTQVLNYLAVAARDADTPLVEGGVLHAGPTTWVVLMQDDPKIAFYAARKYTFVRVALLVQVGVPGVG